MATRPASRAKAASELEGGVDAIQVSAPASASWVMTSQPRRRPSHGGSNRSISGAQRNLKV